jgi:tetratricopeptide (TPR) repeat protein/SAM-dependent methyltransferase
LVNRRERLATGKAGKQGWKGDDGSLPPGIRSSLAVPALLAQALELYRSGRLARAERAYRAILKRAPRDPDALYQFGILAGQTGHLAEAERCLCEAATLRPGEPAFHHALGLLRAIQGRFAEALACHDKALSLNAAHVGALAGRADALHELGNLAEAEAAYRRAAGLAPAAAEIRFGWATVLADLGRLTEAAQIYRELLILNPSSAEVHVNLGTALRDLGRLGEAAAEFQEALALKPAVTAAVDLVSALCDLGKLQEAVDRAADAMRRNPHSSDACRAFALAVSRCGPLDYSPEISAFMEHSLSADDVEHEDLAKAAAWQFRQKHQIAGSPSGAARRVVDEAIEAGGTAGCLADPLLRRLLARTVNTDLELELFLTEVRRKLCLSEDLPAGLNPFLAALALQGFNNAYVFMVSEEEAARLAGLRSDLEVELSRCAALDPALEQKLLRVALYEPLTALAHAKKLLGLPIARTSPLGPVLARCLAEPLEEAELAREIPSLGAIENNISRAVRNQYEEYPYPRWFSLPKLGSVSLPVMLRRKFPHLHLPSFLAGPLEILVAGCGTGRQPIAAAVFLREARVLAIDFSLASLAYAKRMANRFGASTVSFLHADLLALGQLTRDFPVIEAVGVLHHMEDPIAGWRVLCGLLRPGGLMRIGLYSALARADVVTARERIAALGLMPTPPEIRAFRQRALYGDEVDRLPRLALSNDMFDLNGCRDLLFHAKEHRYTPLDLRDMLETLGLEFVGFEFTADQVPRRYRAVNPDDPAMTDLARWAQFEKAHPDTFAGMYMFWCRARAGQ